MDTPRPDFLAELLAESEDADQQKRIEMDRLRADQLLTAVAILEAQMNDINDLVEKEVWTQSSSFVLLRSNGLSSPPSAHEQHSLPI
jgi:hypothetical protein